MPLNAESLSNHAKTVLLAKLACTLTICARDTYEVGTDRVVQPELLRAYNELLHRVAGATRNHLLHTVFLVGLAFLVYFAIGQERTSHGVVAAFLGNESQVV